MDKNLAKPENSPVGTGISSKSAVGNKEKALLIESRALGFNS